MLHLKIIHALWCLLMVGSAFGVGAQPDEQPAVVPVNRVLIVHDPALHNFEDSVSSQVAEVLDELHTWPNVNIQFKPYASDDLKLFASNEPLYNNLILLPSSKRAIPDKANFNQHQLVQFINRGGNVLVVGGVKTTLPEEIRGFLNEFGIFPSPKNFKLHDYFNSKDGVVQLSEDNNVNKAVYPQLPSTAYEGGAALLSNNELLFPIVRAPRTSFTSNATLTAQITQEKTWTFGEQGFLAAGLQARNNARVAWIGSESLLDAELVKWTLNKKNVLRLVFVQHYKQETPNVINEPQYRINDEVIYSIGVSEYVGDKWVPFEPASEDDEIQLSFKMLDPYVRTNLKWLGAVASRPNGESDVGLFFTTFALPDQHGMFTFEVDHKRPGYSYISDKKVVAVRHLANDEFKRSWDITNSWLYLASAVLVVAGWFLFVVSFLYVGKTNVEKKNQ